MMNMTPMGLDPTADRDPNMMPTQSPFMKYVSSSPVRKSYAAPLNTGLTPKQKTLPENLQKEILKFQGEDTALPRKNKFCGGASKPYGKKK